MNDAINMSPPQLQHYKRQCLRNGCKGEITVTKVLGPHIIIETNMNTYDKNSELNCKLSDIPVEVFVESQR